MIIEIQNREDVETWCHDHVSTQGHVIDSVKEFIKIGDRILDNVNVAWIDRQTKERIDIIWDVTDGNKFYDVFIEKYPKITP